MTDRDAVRRGIERPWTNSCFVDDGTAPIVAAVDYFDDRGIPPQERPPPLPVTEADFALRRELAHQIMTGERPTLRDVAPMHATVSDLPKSAAEAMDRPAVLPRRAGSEPLPTTMATVSRVMSMPKTGPPTPRMPATPCSTSSDGLSVGGDRNAPMKKAKIVSSRSSGVFGNATANLKRWAVGVLQSRRSSTEAPEGYSPVESGGDDPPILYDPPCKSPRDRSSPRQHDAIDTAASKAASVEDPPLSSRSTDSQQQECWSILAIYPDIRQDPRYDEDRLVKLLRRGETGLGVDYLMSIVTEDDAAGTGKAADSRWPRRLSDTISNSRPETSASSSSLGSKHSTRTGRAARLRPIDESVGVAM